MKRKKTPYWTGVIARGIKRLKEGKVPFDRDHILQAAAWPTCACGKQDRRIERYSDGKPRDSELIRHGHDFYRALFSQSPRMAKKIIAMIENREMELLIEGGHI